MGQIWTGIHQFKGETHGLGRNEDIRENNDDIDAEPAKGLEGDFHGEVGSLANLQE